MKTDQVSLEDLRARSTCSVDEAALILGVGRSTAYAAVRDGSLPHLKVSHRILISVPRLLALIEGEQAPR
jgi:excisionase family DNA binding protein